MQRYHQADQPGILKRLLALPAEIPVVNRCGACGHIRRNLGKGRPILHRLKDALPEFPHFTDPVVVKQPKSKLMYKHFDELIPFVSLEFPVDIRGLHRLLGPVLESTEDIRLLQQLVFDPPPNGQGVHFLRFEECNQFGRPRAARLGKQRESLRDLLLRHKHPHLQGGVAKEGFRDQGFERLLAKRKFVTASIDGNLLRTLAHVVSRNDLLVDDGRGLERIGLRRRGGQPCSYGGRDHECSLLMTHRGLPITLCSSSFARPCPGEGRRGSASARK